MINFFEVINIVCKKLNAMGNESFEYIPEKVEIIDEEIFVRMVHIEDCADTIWFIVNTMDQDMWVRIADEDDIDLLGEMGRGV